MIAILDYGMGNLHSIEKALEKVGAKVLVTQNKKEIAGADKLVVPGVGAFEDCMKTIRQLDLEKVILDFISSGKPYLGICLGMQILMEKSYEFGEHSGLGLISGEVKRFPDLPEIKIPHMGWNQLKLNPESKLLKGLDNQSQVYFVHSYYIDCQDTKSISSTCEYGIEFCSSLEKDNIYAVQFHPEKSQKTGLRILKNFSEL